MPCKEFELQLSFFVDGEAEDPEAIERHLAACAGCRAYLENLTDAHRRLQEAARALVVAKRSLKRRLILAGASVAAAALLCVLGYVVYLLSLSANPHNINVYAADEMAPGARSFVRVVVENALAPRLERASVVVRLAGREIGRAEGEVATVPVSIPELADGEYRFEVSVEADTGSETLSVPVKVRRPRRVMITTDKPLYQPSQTVHVRLMAKDNLTGRPAADAAARVEVSNPDGTKVLQRELRTSRFGIASLDFELADEVVFGRYRIEVDVGGVKSERAFEVRRYVLPKFKLDARVDRTWYAPGQTARLSLDARYFFGKPVELRNVNVRASARVGSQFSPVYEGPLPPGFPVSNRAEELRFEVEAADAAGHVETAVATVPVSPVPIVITVLPYGGVFVPGRENKVYIVTTYPDGSAAPCTLSTGGSTDENGIAAIAATEPQLSIEASDGRGHFAKTAVDLTEYRGSLALYVDRARLKGGETVSAVVLADSAAGTVYLDLVKARQTLLTRAVELKDGRAEAAIDLPPELDGTLALTAWRFDARGVAHADRRFLIVESPRELSVAVTPRQPRTRPGERIPLDIQTSAPAALSLSAVDAAVFALYESYPGLERVFFAIEEDLLKPRWQLKACPPLDRPISPDRPAEAISARLANVLSATSTPLTQSLFERESRAVEMTRERGFERLGQWFVGIVLPLILIGLVLAAGYVGYVRAGVYGALLNTLGSLLVVVLIVGVLVGGAMGIRQANRGIPAGAMNELADTGASIRPPRSAEEIRVRRHFPETLYWNPEVITDDTGEAHLSLPAADSITTWKLSVSAIDLQGRFGAAQADLVVFQDFFVDLDLPVAFTEGDEVVVPVAVHNYMTVDQDVRLTLEAGDWYESRGPREIDMRVNPGEVASARFPIRILRQGRHKLLLKATGAKESDAIERGVEVAPNGAAVEAVVSDRFRSRARATLTIPPDAIPGASGAWVRLFPSAFSEVVTGLERLVRLPYG